MSEGLLGSVFMVGTPVFCDLEFRTLGGRSGREVGFYGANSTASSGAGLWKFSLRRRQLSRREGQQE